jgi:methylated-DNA-protein-cysteine methyltransferase-like protein
LAVDASAQLAAKAILLDPMPNYYEDVYAIVERIPEGVVTTYGRVAATTPIPNGARGVGWALAGLPPERSGEVPWWRVIGAGGRITNVGNADLQRELLEAEGVAFDAHGRVDLARFLWDGRLSRDRRASGRRSPS